MLFGKQKKNILEDLFRSVFSHFKKLPFWKPENLLIRHFPKLEIAYFYEKKTFQFLLS